jgi:CxxC motif-containing protein (DUF1111 family)
MIRRGGRGVLAALAWGGVAGSTVLAAGVAFGEAGTVAAIDGKPVGSVMALESGEADPGGQATTRTGIATADAFSQLSANMPFARELDFKIGNGLFRKNWVSSPSSTKSSDGLGPLYNARACQACHLKDGRGHPPLGPGPEGRSISMFLRLSVPPRTDDERALLASGRASIVPEPTYGGQLQELGIQGHAGEGRMEVIYEEVPVTLAGGEVVSLRRPTYRVRDPGYGPMHPETMLSPRLTPQMIGLGLLEAIAEADILAHADPDDRDGDGISGKANRVWSIEAGAVALGRFGWKAGQPTVKQQSAEAFAGDIGIGSWMVPRPYGDCTPAQAACRAAPHGGSEAKPYEEIGAKLLDLVAFYARNLAVPARRSPEAPEILRGKQLFHETGCARCHIPSFKTGQASPDAHLRGQVIWPYTDLLLHDMGEGLADGRPEGTADGREWRTAPLWGIGLTETVNGHAFFLHDGRARSLTEAVLWHGGEAQAARDAFAALPAGDRQRLVAFVGSL